MGRLDPLRRLVSPALAVAGSRLLRSPLGRSSIALPLWTLADRYVSYLGAVRQVTTRFGKSMVVSAAPRVENEIFYFGEWEPLLTRYLLDRPPGDGIFLDIGSNIGYFALLAGTRFVQVEAVEASPSIAARLADNIRRNAADNIRLHNVAVGETVGTIDFYVDTRHSGLSSVHPGEGKRLEARVPMVSFDDLTKDIDLRRVEFIKIDIEGSEPPVIRAIRRLRSSLSATVEILVEFDPANGDSLWSEIEPMMQEGFSVHELQGTYDRMEYVDRTRRTKLVPVDRRPDHFCDLLLKNGPAKA